MCISGSAEDGKVEDERDNLCSSIQSSGEDVADRDKVLELIDTVG